MPPRDPYIIPPLIRSELAELATAILQQVQALTEEWGIDESTSPHLHLDFSKLNTAATSFQEQLTTWFPETPVPAEDVVLIGRHNRHAARNLLNHLFGGFYLLQLDPDASQHSERIQSILPLLERALQLVADSYPDSQDPVMIDVSPRATRLSWYETAPHDQPKILVADDDPENRRVLKRLLAPHGFHIDVAQNGLEAVEAIERNDYDAILLDIQMPMMDGFAVLTHLRETGALGRTPVIVVTGLQEEHDAVRCIEIGAEDFLSRPIRPALLMARLNASMEKKRLREKVFEQHFTPELARELARNPDPMKMQPRQAEVSVLFCDIRQFSSISERLGPAQTVEWLSGVLGHFSSLVIDNGGVLVDYTGDELMAMWGAPNEQANHAELACRTGLAILESLPDISEQWRPLIDAETSVGIGINTGEALVGNIGTHRKFKYGPLGTTVNLASRVQGATKYLKTDLLVSNHTIAQIAGGLPNRRLCRVRVQNISTSIDLHELQPPGSTEEWPKLAACYESALLAYEAADFDVADATLDKVLSHASQDGPALQLQARIAEARIRSHNTFSPVWNLPGK